VPPILPPKHGERIGPEKKYWSLPFHSPKTLFTGRQYQNKIFQGGADCRAIAKRLETVTKNQKVPEKVGGTKKKKILRFGGAFPRIHRKKRKTFQGDGQFPIRATAAGGGDFVVLNGCFPLAGGDWLAKRFRTPEVIG